MADATEEFQRYVQVSTLHDFLTPSSMHYISLQIASFCSISILATVATVHTHFVILEKLPEVVLSHKGRQ